MSWPRLADGLLERNLHASLLCFCFSRVESQNFGEKEHPEFILRWLGQ